jgi:putative inorganic carbon (hco3(-)) transporter
MRQEICMQPSARAQRGAVGTPQDSVLSESDRQRVYGLDFGFLYRSFFREGLAFFFLCFYFFIEYGRFQTIYPQIDVIRWGAISAGLTLLLLFFDRRREHPNNILVFAVYGCLLLTFVSMTYALDEQIASQRGSTYLNWLIVFFITISLVTSEKRFAFFLLLYMLWNFKMSLHGAIVWAGRGFGFADWGVRGPAGWFANSGELGLQMAMICAISLGFYLGIRGYLSGWRKWAIIAIPVTSFMSVMAASTRGDYLAMVAALLWLALASKGKRLLVGTLVAVILVVAYWAVPAEMVERFEAAGDDYTSYTRETRWKAGFEIFKDNPVLGVGTGSWVAYYQLRYPREWGPEGWGLVHNSFLEVIGEHGGLGLLFWCLIFGGMFLLGYRTRALASRLDDPVFLWTSRGFDAATVAFLIGGSFMSVFWYPYVWVHAAMIVSLYVVARKRVQALEAPSGEAKERRRRLRRPPGEEAEKGGRNVPVSARQVRQG